MSAHVLREKTRAELLKQIESEGGYLADPASTHDFATARLRQGVIVGLQRAIDLLNNNYKDLNG